MKRWLLAVLLLSAVSLGFPSVSGAQTTTPILVLKENCSFKNQGVQVYAVDVGVTGFPPNTQFGFNFTFQYINPDGSLDGTGGAGPGTLTTDANGEFFTIFGTTGIKTFYTFTVNSPYLPGGTQTKTVRATCEPTPTSVEQCKKGGYLAFNFSNQGQCVAFVQRGPVAKAGP